MVQNRTDESTHLKPDFSSFMRGVRVFYSEFGRYSNRLRFLYVLLFAWISSSHGGQLGRKKTSCACDDPLFPPYSYPLHWTTKATRTRQGVPHFMGGGTGEALAGSPGEKALPL